MSCATRLRPEWQWPGADAQHRSVPRAREREDHGEHVRAPPPGLPPGCGAELGVGAMLAEAEQVNLLGRIELLVEAGEDGGNWMGYWTKGHYDPALFAYLQLRLRAWRPGASAPRPTAAREACLVAKGSDRRRAGPDAISGDQGRSSPRFKRPSLISTTTTLSGGLPRTSAGKIRAAGVGSRPRFGSAQIALALIVELVLACNATPGSPDSR
jgi:hypothetical protein